MKKRSMFQQLFADKDAEKAWEKRFARWEMRQKSILKLMQREAFKDNSILQENFATAGFSVHSKQSEDGHILHIFQHIGATNRRFVEIGIQDGLECNAANLAFNFGWGGVLIEGSEEDAAQARKHYVSYPHVKVVRSFVTKGNAAVLLRDSGAHPEADLFSLDIDGNDYWIWESLAGFNPRLVVVEYNAAFGPERAVTIPYKDDFKCGAQHSRLYFGASLAALDALARRKGYTFVGAAETGPNAFFVRNDALKSGLKAASIQSEYRPLHLRRFMQAEADAVFQLPLVEV